MSIKTHIKDNTLCVESFLVKMSFVIEALIEWICAHMLSKCIKIQVPDEVGRGADPETVFEMLFADGVRNWGRRFAYVTWLKESYGHIKGFMVLCKIHRKRLR